MFGFLRRSATRPISESIRSAIEKDGNTTFAGDPSRLRMVETGGRYSDRKVTYFRVFDPTSAAQQTLDIRRYKDFDVFPALVLRSGHVERDGTVVLTRAVGADATVRTRAGRTVPNLDASAGNGVSVTPLHPTTAETASSGPTA
jgi:hypothetical protein